MDFKFPKVNTKNSIAFITIIGILGIAYVLAFVEIPEKNREGFFMVVGILVRSAWDPIYRSIFPNRKGIEPPAEDK